MLPACGSIVRQSASVQLLAGVVLIPVTAVHETYALLRLLWSCTPQDLSRLTIQSVALGLAPSGSARELHCPSVHTRSPQRHRAIPEAIVVESLLTAVVALARSGRLAALQLPIARRNVAICVSTASQSGLTPIFHS